MPSAKRKTRSNKTATTSGESSVGGLQEEMPPAVGSLPVTSYIPFVGVHTTLLAFTALFLPRTTLLLDLTGPKWDSTQLTSRDRPQHPFLEALTMSPASTLACMCAGAAVLQGWWGGWIRDQLLASVVEGNAAERKLEKVSFDRKKFMELVNAWAATIGMSFVTHGVLILFGAPLTSLILRTYLLSLLLSILVVLPPAYVFGRPKFSGNTASLVQRLTWIRLFVEWSLRTPVERAIVYPALGTLLGSWLGIIPIALDWDRPWQSWPLTPAFGAIGGYIIASLYALTINALTINATSHFTGQKILFQEPKQKSN